MSMEEKMHITSKGCSRGFILCVLHRALNYVRQRHLSGEAVSFPFCQDEIMSWLMAAQIDCSISAQSFQAGLGGTFYDVEDASSYWTQPQQFCTWWKNNIERKNKFLLLQRDASYNEETDPKQIARAAYCQNAIAMSLSIKKYFHRYLSKDKGAKIVQYIIPYTMPKHMTFLHHDLTEETQAKSASPLEYEKMYVPQDATENEVDLDMMSFARLFSTDFVGCSRDQVKVNDTDRKRKQRGTQEKGPDATLKQLRNKENHSSQYTGSVFPFPPNYHNDDALCMSDSGSDSERSSPHEDKGSNADTSPNVEVSRIRIPLKQDTPLSLKPIFQPSPLPLNEYPRPSLSSSASQTESIFGEGEFIVSTATPPIQNFHTLYNYCNDQDVRCDFSALGKDNSNLSSTSWPLPSSSLSTIKHPSCPFTVGSAFEEDLMALLTEDIDNGKSKTNDELLLSIPLSPCFTPVQHYNSIKDYGCSHIIFSDSNICTHDLGSPFPLNKVKKVKYSVFDEVRLLDNLQPTLLPHFCENDFIFSGQGGGCSSFLDDDEGTSVPLIETDEHTSLQYTVPSHNEISSRDELYYNSYGDNSSLKANDCSDLLAVISTIIDDVDIDKLKYERYF